MRLRLKVSYHGAAFAGWQSQPRGLTVQDALEKAFDAVGVSGASVQGAGRTDAGVHALAQCAHVDVPDGRFSEEIWLRAVNAHLPPGVRVMAVRTTAKDFHARFDARGKIYRYAIWNASPVPPLESDRAWHVPWPLDRGVLRAACALFVGRHDFAAFSARRGGVPCATERTISAVRCVFRGPALTITFEGEGFLYKMVRMLVAAAVRCAVGKLTLAEIASRLAVGKPRLSYVAPAQGLCLMRVRY